MHEEEVRALALEFEDESLIYRVMECRLPASLSKLAVGTIIDRPVTPPFGTSAQA
jgi:hypothetical protein